MVQRSLDWSGYCWRWAAARCRVTSGSCTPASRGMPHFKLLGMGRARNAWYDFLPSLMLAALPFIPVRLPWPADGQGPVIWTRISASISYDDAGRRADRRRHRAQLAEPGAVRLGLRLSREGLDFTTPLLMVGIPVALACSAPRPTRCSARSSPPGEASAEVRALRWASRWRCPMCSAFLLYRPSTSTNCCTGTWHCILIPLRAAAAIRRWRQRRPARRSPARWPGCCRPVLLGLLFMPGAGRRLHARRVQPARLPARHRRLCRG